MLNIHMLGYYLGVYLIFCQLIEISLLMILEKFYYLREKYFTKTPPISIISSRLTTLKFSVFYLN